MGLFELIFGGRKVRVFDDRVWLTASRRIDDIVAHVRAQRANDNYPVVVTHFKATQEKILAALTKAQIKTHVVAPPELFPSDIKEEWRKDGAVLVLPSDMIPFDKNASRKPCTKDDKHFPVTIHLVEHYPTQSRDERVLGLDNLWPMKTTFLAYTSLEDPLMVHAEGDKVRLLVKRLGIKENVPLSHHFLNQSIRLAQRRIEKGVRHEQTCDSPEEWFERNLRKKR